MREKVFKFVNNKILMFILLLGVFIVYFILESLIQRGANFTTYFVTDMYDSYMDYFNMVSNMYDGNPYLRDANYPALAFVIYKVFFHLVAPSVNSSNGEFVKSIQNGQIGYLFYFIISLLAFYELIVNKINKNKVVKLLFAGVVIFSGPFLFQFERANMIFIALIFTTIFVFYYNDENKYLREFSYICLAIAVALKIYPVVFGLLLLKKGNLAATIRTLVYGIVFFFTPFFLFDGFESIKTMIHGIFLSSSMYDEIGYGCNFSFSNFIKIIAAFLGDYIKSTPFIINIIPIVLGVLSFLISKKLWKKVLSLCIMMIWFPTFSFTYTLIFLVIPLVLFLNEEHESTDWIYLLYFLLAFIPYVTKDINNINWITGELVSFRLSYGMVIINIALSVMMITLLLDGLYNLSVSKGKIVVKGFAVTLSIIISILIIFSAFYINNNPISPQIDNMELYSSDNKVILNREISDINNENNGIIAIWTDGFDKIQYNEIQNKKWIYGKNYSKLYLINSTNRIQTITLDYEISTGEKELAGYYYYYVKGDTFEEKNVLNVVPHKTTREISLNPGLNKIIFQVDNSNYYIDNMEKSFKVTNFQILMK